MSLRKRITEARERSARERARRREERRRADRAKAGASAADRSKARTERAKAKVSEQAEPKAAEPAKAKAGRKPDRKPAPDRRPKTEPKAKVAAAKPAGRRRSLASDAGKVSGALRSVIAEVLKLGREMIAIPVQIWLAAAEVAGAFVLRVWLRAVRPALLALWRLARATLRWAQRHVTPARAVAAVSLVAIAALVASQWLDYHAVSVGSDAYAGAIGDVAPAPVIESEIAGNAHAWVMLPLAVVALVALVLAFTGRRRAAFLLVPVGAVVIAISLLVDAPKGLDEGSAAVTYEGANASLLEGFWMQIVVGAVLICCGLMLPRYLRPAPARSAAPTGPTLFQSGASAARKLAKRRPHLRRPARRTRPKRKVQGAGT